MDVLLNYSWPGNIKELENLIEKLVIFSEGNVIELKNLNTCEFKQTLFFEKDLVDERTLLTQFNYLLPLLSEQGIDLNNLLREIEIHYLKQALEISKGVKN